MSNIPKQRKQSLTSIQNFCQTFLSSCCDYNSRNTTSNPSILEHRHPPMQKTEFSNPFCINTSDKQETQFKTILKNKIIPRKLDLQPPIDNPALVPLSSLQIEDQKNAISKIIYRSELTPLPSPALRSMAPSPKNPLDEDLERIEDLLVGSEYILESEFDINLTKLNALEALYQTEKLLIQRIRAPGISRTNARKLLKIDKNQRYDV